MIVAEVAHHSSAGALIVPVLMTVLVAPCAVGRLFFGLGDPK